MTSESAVLAARLREPPFSSSPLSGHMVRAIEEQHVPRPVLETRLLAAKSDALHTGAGSSHGPATCSSPTALREPSSARVFAIPELVSLILSAISPLPTRRRDASNPYEAEDPRSGAVQSRANCLWTLVHAQHTNRLCRDLIKSTQSLQQTLFITPQTTSSRSWTVTASSTQPALNPLVQTTTHWRFSHLRPEQMRGRFSAHMIIERKDCEHLRSLSRIHKTMLLSQPPVTDLTALIWERATEPHSAEARMMPPSGFYPIKRVIHDEGGITLGKVLEIANTMFDEDATLLAIKLCTA